MGSWIEPRQLEPCFTSHAGHYCLLAYKSFWSPAGRRLWLSRAAPLVNFPRFRIHQQIVAEVRPDPAYKGCALGTRRSGGTCASGRKPPEMTHAFEETRTWAQILGPYRTPDVSRSIFELLV